jgi:hypothetical protein
VHSRLVRHALLASVIAAIVSAMVPSSARAQATPASARARKPFSFVVIGHVRGNTDAEPYAMLPELIAEVRKEKPDLVFVGGDMIWGAYTSATVDSAVITRSWEQLDSALATLGVPVYRVPGNHDISDPVTRDIYRARYGQLPQAVTYGGSTFILLNSTWVPSDNTPASATRPHVRGLPIDSTQREFLKQTLADTASYEHAFVFMHHLLWFDDDAPWWKEVHPLLRHRKVGAVFSGDLGPMKFSHETRDSVPYFQTSMEGFPSVEIHRLLEGSRMMGAQFDNFLKVAVNGPAVNVEVKTLGAISSGKFSPQRYAAVYRYEPPPKPISERVWGLIGSPARIGALGLGMAVLFGAGFAAAMLWMKRRGAPGARAVRAS